jgi:hypothetical protein
MQNLNTVDGLTTELLKQTPARRFAAQTKRRGNASQSYNSTAPGKFTTEV